MLKKGDVIVGKNFEELKICEIDIRILEECVPVYCLFVANSKYTNFIVDNMVSETYARLEDKSLKDMESFLSGEVFVCKGTYFN